MMMTRSTTTQTKPALAEVLTLDQVDGPVGYAVGGFKPGPSLVVIGHGDIATAVYNRLLKVPTLGWIRGRLTLLELDAIPAIDAETLGQIMDIDHADHIMMLPHAKSDVDTVSDGYWTVLEVCAALGMISGRGVPRSKANLSLQIVS